MRFPHLFSLQKSPQIQRPIKRVAVLRDDHIGDLVYTLPLAKVLQAQQIEPILFCNDYAAAVAAAYPHWQAIYPIARLQDETLEFDVLIVPNTEEVKRHRKTIQALRRNRKIQVITRLQRLWPVLFCSDYLFTLAEKERANLHETQINMAFLKPILGEIAPQMALDQMDCQLALPKLDLPMLHSEQWRNSSFRLMIHLGSHGNGKHWPLARFIQVIQALGQVKQLSIWLSGSEKEGQHFRAQIPEVLALPHVEDLFGKFSLQEFMCSIQYADGLIANGTGPLHLAGALNTPSLGLFPHAWRIGAARWRPLAANARSLSPKSCASNCSGDCRCMETIEVAQVLEVVQQWQQAKLAAN